MVKSYLKLLFMEIKDTQAVETLLKDLYSLTSMKVCLFDENMNEISFYPSKYGHFCSLLRSNKEEDSKCKECDRRAIEYVKKTKKPYLYICHAGLLESISPIIYNDEIVGYIGAGQVRTDDSLLKYNSKIDLIKEFEKIDFVSKEKATSIVNIIQACAGYEYLKNLMVLTNNKIEKSITMFIDSNIDKQINVEMLCDEFHVSRNELYRVFKLYFNTTPANYIKDKRINKACELLLNTTYPINKIADLVGIEDYNYFTKVFKKDKGVKPTSFRRNQTK